MNRIAFLIPGLDRIGGAERQLMLLAKGLAGAVGGSVSSPSRARAEAQPRTGRRRRAFVSP